MVCWVLAMMMAETYSYRGATMQNKQLSDDRMDNFAALNAGEKRPPGAGANEG